MSQASDQKGRGSAHKRHINARLPLNAATVIGIVFLLVGHPGSAWGQKLQRHPGPPSKPTSTMRVNTSSAGVEANGATDVSSVSADGRFVAYASIASNLVPGDSVGIRDVFVFDSVTRQTTLASVNLSGQPGNGASGTSLAISADGRYVAFDSWASDLVPNDTNGQLDIFVRDRFEGTTTRVSVDSSGAQANGASAGTSMSADGRYVAFSSWANNLIAADSNLLRDVFLHDRLTANTKRISQTASGVGGSGGSHSPGVSTNGRFVAYSTRANNLVSEPLGPYHYIFVHDTETIETWHVSVNSAGDFAHGQSDTRPAITPDGRYVAFASVAYNLVFPDLNFASDIFLHDHLTGETTRVSVGALGAEGNGGSILPSLSDDGRYVAFVSSANNLGEGDTNGRADVFRYDRTTGSVRCISEDAFGHSANGASTMPAMSSDGSLLVFASRASDLVMGDTNQLRDVFVYVVP